MKLNVSLFIFTNVLVSCFGEIVSKDLCQYESFQPRCLKGEVIIIESAEYGRMHTGRCIEIDEEFAGYKNDPKWIGCSVDVAETLGHKCSGRPECDVSINDKDLGVVTRPCYKALSMYLNVKYQCLQILSPSSSCIIAVSPESRFFLLPLFGKSTTDYFPNPCGSIRQPWTFEASLGQKIKLTTKLIASESQTEGFGKCADSYGIGKKIKIGHVIDQVNGKRSDYLCLTPQLGSIFNYESKGNLLGFVIEGVTHKGIINNNSFIMFEVKALGCLDLIPAEDAWSKRNNDEATIGCYSSRQTWQLRCSGHQWVGVIGNCSMGKFHDPIIEKRKPSDEIQHSNQVLALVAICGFGLVICLIIVCCGIFCVKRISYSYKNSLDKFQTLNHTLRPMPNGTMSVLPEKDGFIQQHYNIANTSDNSAYYILDHENLGKLDVK